MWKRCNITLGPIDLFPGSSVSQNFKLDKNRVQRFDCQITIFISNTFLKIEQKPALATLIKESVITEAGGKNNTHGRIWPKITMTAASCFCSRKEYALTGQEVPVSLILIQTGSLSSTFYAFNM